MIWPENFPAFLNCGRERLPGVLLFPQRHFAAATALLLAGALSFPGRCRAEGQDPTADCDGAAGLAMLTSPVSPWKGAPLRVVFTAEEALDGELSLIGPDGSVAIQSRERHGGPPYFWFAEIASRRPQALGRPSSCATGASAECATITREIDVRRSASPQGASGKGRLAPSQYLEPRDGELVLGMDREALRRADRGGSVVEGTA